MCVYARYAHTECRDGSMNGQYAQYSMYRWKWQGCSLLTGTGDARSLPFCSPHPSAGWSRCKWGQGRKRKISKNQEKLYDNQQMYDHTFIHTGSALGEHYCHWVAGLFFWPNNLQLSCGKTKSTNVWKIPIFVWPTRNWHVAVEGKPDIFSSISFAVCLSLLCGWSGNNSDQTCP